MHNLAILINQIISPNNFVLFVKKTKHRELGIVLGW